MFATSSAQKRHLCKLFLYHLTCICVRTKKKHIKKLLTKVCGLMFTSVSFEYNNIDFVPFFHLCCGCFKQLNFNLKLSRDVHGSDKHFHLKALGEKLLIIWDLNEKLKTQNSLEKLSIFYSIALQMKLKLFWFDK